MKSITVGGPLAYLQARVAEHEQMEASLRSELHQVRALAQHQAQQLQRSQQQLASLATQRDQQAATATALAADLAACTAERDSAQQQLQHLQQESSAQIEQLKEEVAKLSKEQQVALSELQRVAVVKASTEEKLVAVRQKLSLSDAEGRQFLQELDGARARVTELEKEQQQLSTDHEALAQQCTSRAAHCMTLISDNKRLMDALDAMRQQLADARAAAWSKGLRPGGLASKQAVVPQERPPWQSLNSSKPSSSASTTCSGSPSQAPAKTPAASSAAKAASKGATKQQPSTNAKQDQGSSFVSGSFAQDALRKALELRKSSATTAACGSGVTVLPGGRSSRLDSQQRADVESKDH